MLKAVLVDDEILEREGIRTLISWDDLGIELSGEASCATNALQLVSQIKPEILITDIKMPGKNGIDLVSSVKEFLPDINVVFISGYQDFMYAKKAILLDAYGYVLKPVDKNELTDALKRIVQHYHNTVEEHKINHQFEESLPYLQQKFLNGLLTGEITGDETQLIEQSVRLKLPFDARVFNVAVISPDMSCTADDVSRKKANVDLRALGEWEASVSQRFSMKSVFMEDHLALIIRTDDSDTADPELENHLNKLIQKLGAEYGTSFSIGFSEGGTGLGCLAQLFGQAAAMVKHKWYLGKGTVISASRIKKAEKTGIFSTINDVLQDIRNEISKDINAGDVNRIGNSIRRYFDALPWDEKILPQSVRNHCLDLINVSEHILSEHGETLNSILTNKVALIDELLLIDTLTETQAWMIEKFQEISRYIEGKRAEQNYIVINRIIDIIENYYSQDLTVEGFAEEVYLSPNYIRKIFKKEMGKTILDYIIQTRMNKAIELMRTTFLSIKDIAEKVGYKDSSYFGQVFKQKYGVTPGEYRKSVEKT